MDEWSRREFAERYVDFQQEARRIWADVRDSTVDPETFNLRVIALAAKLIELKRLALEIRGSSDVPRANL